MAVADLDQFQRVNDELGFGAGDRVLIAPEEGEERTKVGLYLPATAVETQQVQEGLIIAAEQSFPIGKSTLQTIIVTDCWPKRHSRDAVQSRLREAVRKAGAKVKDVAELVARLRTEAGVI